MWRAPPGPQHSTTNMPGKLPVGDELAHDFIQPNIWFEASYRRPPTTSSCDGGLTHCNRVRALWYDAWIKDQLRTASNFIASTGHHVSSSFHLDFEKKKYSFFRRFESVRWRLRFRGRDIWLLVDDLHSRYLTRLITPWEAFCGRPRPQGYEYWDQVIQT
jgi:hypothetical protein